MILLDYAKSVNGSEVSDKMPISLKAARVNAGYNQKVAAKLIGVSKTTLSKWECGKAYPSTKYIPAITDTYRVRYDDISFCSKITL
nr:MAG TPA: Helix-turn-helix XRE-family like protein [Caudoviricetes sp.]